MKKILLILFSLLLIQPVMAKNIKVEALSDFSTTNPSETWQIKIVEGFVTKEGRIIQENSIIEGKIIDVTSPKRMKRAASFKFVPLTYLNPDEIEAKNVNGNFVGKYGVITNNKKEFTKSTAITAGSAIVSPLVGISIGVIEGIVKNENGNRAKSAVVQAYKNTPLSYFSKGQDIELKKGDILIINFKTIDEEDSIE